MMRSFFVFAALLVAACAVQPRSGKQFIPVANASEDVSLWSLSALSDALQDPNTPAALVPYLAEALNDLMLGIYTGNNQDSIIVVTPAGLLDPIAEVPVGPVVTPVAPVETPVAPIETPVAPVAAAASAASSPLVQLIVNINQAASAPAPAAPVAPVNPIPIGPVVEVNPVDVIAVMPLPNPVDVIAVSPPELNPIDIANPLPIVPEGAAGIVGPIV